MRALGDVVEDWRSLSGPPWRASGVWIAVWGCLSRASCGLWYQVGTALTGQARQARYAGGGAR